MFFDRRIVFLFLALALAIVGLLFVFRTHHPTTNDGKMDGIPQSDTAGESAAARSVGPHPDQEPAAARGATAPKRSAVERPEQWWTIGKGTSLGFVDSRSLALDRGVIDLLELNPTEVKWLNEELGDFLERVRTAEKKNVYVRPGNAGMPFESGTWSAVAQPFWKEARVWQFWKEPDAGFVAGKIDEMLAAGVTCIAQEYGPYSSQMWRHFIRAMCIRHPIDRLYGDFLHTREMGVKIAGDVCFEDWVRAGCPSISTTLYVEQLGMGDLMRARRALEDFQVIIVQEYYAETLAHMRQYGWRSVDPEKHFKSWTPRRTTTGRQAFAEQPDILRILERHCVADLQIYYRAVELALQGKGTSR